MHPQSCDGSGEDAALLLTIKDAEISTLRQQMAQLADDLKRNLAVSSCGLRRPAASTSGLQLVRSMARLYAVWTRFHGRAFELATHVLYRPGDDGFDQSVCAAARCWPPRMRMA